jgi:hypothetical protein
MPRDFVPCLYTDRQLPNVEEYGWQRRLEVIELFALSDVVTEQPGIIMSLDSHAYFLDALDEDPRALSHLFTTFYAAMAALE